MLALNDTVTVPSNHSARATVVGILTDRRHFDRFSSFLSMAGIYYAWARTPEQAPSPDETHYLVRDGNGTIYLGTEEWFERAATLAPST